MSKNRTSLKPVAEGRIPQLSEDRPKQILESFQAEDPQYCFDQLVLPVATYEQLETLLTKVKFHSVLYEDFGLREVDPLGGRTSIGFYGPPGTGKSMAAEAVAERLGKKIIKANYAEIESKYVGETAKNIQAAFDAAEETDALLFFDEADSILGQRLTEVKKSTDHAVNVSRSVMLLCLDKFKGVTVFATNLFSNYDPAFMRRILGHIEMALPDQRLRTRIWFAKIPKKLPVENSLDIEILAKASEGLSGGEIVNATVTAASAALCREGISCVVTQEDFLKAIGQVKDAKQAAQVQWQPNQ